MILQAILLKTSLKYKEQIIKYVIFILHNRNMYNV